jgi:MFS family permease
VEGEWKAGWPAVVGSMAGFGFGGSVAVMTAGLFVVPMKHALGSSVSAVTIGPIFIFCIAATMPLAGKASDSLDPRKVAIIGLIALCACMLLLSAIPLKPSLLYAAAVLTGIAGAFTCAPPFAAIIAQRFERHFGLAFGIVTNGSAIAALLAIPVTVYAIANGGWRMGYLAISAMIALIGLSSVVLFCPRLEAGQQKSPSRRPITADLAPVLTDRRFWYLLIVMLSASMGIGGFLANLQPMLALQGIDPTSAAAVGMAYALAISVGRIGGGWALDRYNPNVVAALLMGSAAIGSGLVSLSGDTISFWFVIGCAALIGLGHGAEVDFVAFFAFRIFRHQAYSTVVGLFVMATAVGMASGGIAFAALYDMFGQYREAERLGASCFLLAAVMMLLSARGAGTEAMAEQPVAASGQPAHKT